MSNLLATLFAVLDCDAWSVSQLTSWTDRLISRLESPKIWLINLSINGSVNGCLEVICDTMKESNVLLPDDIGDLMAGLILLRFDNGEFSAEVAKTHLVDVIDAYGTNCVDAEAAGKLDLNDAVYNKFREMAKQAMRYLDSEQLLETERWLIETR